jgi:molecular chaperone GrpE (heat shock protein)
MMDDRDGRERDDSAGAAPADVDGGSEDAAAGLEGANGAGGAGTPEEGGVAAADVVAELERVQRELSALADRHLRLAAEFDNYR